MEQVDIGLVNGRFQVLHLDHMKYILEAKKHCKKLIIGITSPDPWQSPAESCDENRGKSTTNPCTYYERMIMIENALVEAGIPYSEFVITPFPIGFPERIEYYAPQDAIYFLTIYDSWGEEKLKRLKNLNLKTYVLWKSKDKGISATKVRNAIIQSAPWEQMVYPSTARIIKELGIDERIRALNFKK